MSFLSFARIFHVLLAHLFSRRYTFGSTYQYTEEFEALELGKLEEHLQTIWLRAALIFRVSLEALPLDKSTSSSIEKKTH